jgi:hypothetical protein
MTPAEEKEIIKRFDEKFSVKYCGNIDGLRESIKQFLISELKAADRSIHLKVDGKLFIGDVATLQKCVEVCIKLAEERGYKRGRQSMSPLGYNPDNVIVGGGKGVI